MTNDKATPLNRTDIAGAIATELETSMEQTETGKVNPGAEGEKAEPTAKKPRRKLGSRGAAAG